MASGFFALLDDIATLAKATVSTIDDVAAGATKASAKSIGVVIDDTAVTPQYVQGISPKRELPVIKRIAKGSLKNKFLFILPIALVLTWVAPWALPILLIIGGTYLSFEGAEKVAVWLGLEHKEKHPTEIVENSKKFEDNVVNSAVRTDLVLSTEILLIAMSNIESTDNIDRIMILVTVALFMTFLVYGIVAVLIKMDDFGAHLANKNNNVISMTGKSIVKSMPATFKVIGVIGTLAMLWVGGHIVIKSLHDLGFNLFHNIIEHIVEIFHNLGGIVTWLVDTTLSGLFGLILGMIVLSIILAFNKRFKNHSE